MKLLTPYSFFGLPVSIFLITMTHLPSVSHAQVNSSSTGKQVTSAVIGNDANDLRHAPLPMNADIAAINARVEILTRQFETSEKLRHEAEEKGTQRLIWVGGFVGTLFTILTALMGLFINSRIKDPEEYRENLRAHLFQELEASRKDVIARTDSELIKAREQLLEAQRVHTTSIDELFRAARTEAEKFRDQNEEMVSALRNLTSLGQPSPEEKPEAETLYYLAEQSRAEGGAEGRAKGLRYLRRLASSDIPAIAPVLHNAAILAKQYGSQELAVGLFRRAYERSQGMARYGASLAHELALSHNKDESLQLFKKLLEEGPADDGIFHFYIDALASLGLGAEAEAVMIEKGERFKDSAKVQREYADLLVSLGRYSEALQRASLATQLDPADEIAWGYRGKIAVLIGDLDTAIVSFEHAISLADESSPRLPLHFSRLADVYRLKGDNKLAMWNYQASIIAEKSPSRSVMWLNLLHDNTKNKEDRAAPLRNLAAAQPGGPPDAAR